MVGVHMVVTLEPLRNDETTVAGLTREDVKVRQGKQPLLVTDWVPGRGSNAALQLFVLIDDTSDTSLGSQLDDLTTFITAQPATTWIGVGYMRNTSIEIVQNFTNDHALTAKALRLLSRSMPSVTMRISRRMLTETRFSGRQDCCILPTLP